MEALGIKILVVTFEVGALAQVYQRETKLRWPLLVDETRSLYSAYGMDRGRWWHIYGPASCWTYFNLLLCGRRLHRAKGDVNQLGGDVLIDPNGVVRVHHVGSGPADRPSVSSLLKMVRKDASGLGRETSDG